MSQKPALSIFSGSQSLGQVAFEENQINVKFTEYTYGFTDVDGNTAINWKGKLRTIVIQGSHGGEGFSGATPDDKLGDFISTMEIWVRGADQTLNVQAAATYTDSFGVTYSVKAFDWSWRRSFSDPSRIIYTLLLKQV